MQAPLESENPSWHWKAQALLAHTGEALATEVVHCSSMIHSPLLQPA